MTSISVAIASTASRVGSGLPRVSSVGSGVGDPPVDSVGSGLGVGDVDLSGSCTTTSRSPPSPSAAMATACSPPGDPMTERGAVVNPTDSRSESPTIAHAVSLSSGQTSSIATAE